jgi:hypothetical protein
MEVANTQADYDIVTITAIKSFILQAPGGGVKFLNIDTSGQCYKTIAVIFHGKLPL